MKRLRFASYCTVMKEKEVFDNWQAFELSLTEYEDSTYSKFSKRSSMSVSRYNAGLKNKERCYSEELGDYNRTYQCTHAFPIRRRGTGQRTGHSFRFTGCSATISARLIRREEKVAVQTISMKTEHSGHAVKGNYAAMFAHNRMVPLEKIEDDMKKFVLALAAMKVPHANIAAWVHRETGRPTTARDIRNKLSLLKISDSDQNSELKRWIEGSTEEGINTSAETNERADLITTTYYGDREAKFNRIVSSLRPIAKRLCEHDGETIQMTMEAIHLKFNEMMLELTPPREKKRARTEVIPRDISMNGKLSGTHHHSLTEETSIKLPPSFQGSQAVLTFRPPNGFPPGAKMRKVGPPPANTSTCILHLTTYMSDSAEFKRSANIRTRCFIKGRVKGWKTMEECVNRKKRKEENLRVLQNCSYIPDERNLEMLRTYMEKNPQCTIFYMAQNSEYWSKELVMKWFDISTLLALYECRGVEFEQCLQKVKTSKHNPERCPERCMHEYIRQILVLNEGKLKPDFRQMQTSSFWRMLNKFWLDDQCIVLMCYFLAQEYENLQYVDPLLLEMEGNWSTSRQLRIEKQHIAFPINLDNTHWTAAFANIRSGTIHVYDSFTSYYDATVRKVNAVILPQLQLRFPTTKFHLTKFEGPTQLDGHSCGIFIMEFIECMASGRSTFTMQDEEPLHNRIKWLYRMMTVSIA